VSQAILGQPAWIEGGEGDFFRVRTWDGYRGWAEARFVISRTYTTAYASGRAVAVVKPLFSEIYTSPDTASEIITKAVVTTELEVTKTSLGWVKVGLPDGREGFVPDTDVRLVDRTASVVIFPPSGDKLIQTAKRFIGVPYLWGGTTPFGIDCSGFVQLVYHIRNVTLARDAWMQAEDERGVPVEREELRAGDLMFFASGKNRSKVTHVGLAMGDGRFIHSSGSLGVAITAIDDPYYTSIYWGARRVRFETWESGLGVWTEQGAR
jgi:cell wall-associated NlpC family hydrolase